MAASTTDTDEQQRDASDVETVCRHAGQLLGERRRNLAYDGHVRDFNHTKNGEKIHRIEYDDKDTGETKTIDVNRSRLFGAAPSTSANLEIFEIEAELVANGVDLKNPHVPTNDSILAELEKRLDENNLVPAWDVVDGNAEV